MTRFTWREQYDDEADARERAATDIDFTDSPSKTQQHFTAEADLNVIMKRFGITDGAIPPAAIDPKYFGDFSDVVDMQVALNRTRIANDNFNALPADLRRQFNNDPVQLFAWVSNPKNTEEAVKLGLLSKEATAIAAPQEPPK